MLKQFILTHSVNCFKLAVLTATSCISEVLCTAQPQLPESQITELALLLQAADENAPQLVEQTILAEEARQRLKQAEAAYYPRVDLNSNLGFRQTTYDADNIEDENSTGVTFYAAINRPFYHWGAIEAAIEQARLDNNTEALHRSLILRQIRRNIRADYLNLLVNKVELEKLELQRLIAQEDLKQYASSTEEGRISKIDAQMAELNLSQHLMNIEQVIAEQARIKASFKQRVGWHDTLNLPGKIPTQNIEEISQFIEVENTTNSTNWIFIHPEVQTLRNHIEREKKELVRIKAQQRPLVNFTAYASQDQRDTGVENDVDAITYFAGLSVSWNIFDGFATSSRKVESMARRRRHEYKLENYKQEIVTQAANIRRQISFRLKQLQIDTTRSQLNAERYQSKEEASLSGFVSEKELFAHNLNHVESQLNLARSETVLILLINDYLDLTAPVDTLRQ